MLSFAFMLQLVLAEAPQGSEVDAASPSAPSEGELPSWSELPEQPAREPPSVPPRGIGLLVGGGVGFGISLALPWAAQVWCEDPTCTRGHLERFVLLASIGMIGGGAWMQGHRDGVIRRQHDEPARKLIGRRSAGWTLFSLGIIGMIGEASLSMACSYGRRGPFYVPDGEIKPFSCREWTSVLMMNGSASVAAIGFGLGMSAEAERRVTRKGAAKLALLPYADHQRAGLTLVGRF